MSGGFFRGTSADQDTRFSNKQAKLLKSQKFPPELEHLVDMTKVKMDVIRPWIATRVTELLGFEDEVLINFIYGLLDGKDVNGKQVQISLTGFMEKNTGKFMKELWTLLLSAQKNASGVPQQFLDAKEEETKKKKAEADRIAGEIKRMKEKEVRELEQEKTRKMDGGFDDSANDAGIERNLKNDVAAGRSSHDGKQVNGRNGLGRHRVSRSPHLSDRSHSHSHSPYRSRHSRSISKSVSCSNSRERGKSRSISRSISPRRHSVSPERVYNSPGRRSLSPCRRHRGRVSVSPLQRRSSHSRRRSISPEDRRSPSPMRLQKYSPLQRRSPSPVGRRWRSPLRRGSPSSRRRSPSPVRHRSPLRRRALPSPARRRSPSPRRRRSPSPGWRRSPPSPWHWRSPSPRRQRSISPRRRRSPSPAHHRSPSPARRHYRRSPPRRRSPSPPRRSSSSPIRRRSSPPGHRRSSPLSMHRSPLPHEWNSSSRSPSLVRGKSPGWSRRSPIRSPTERIRTGKRKSPAHDVPQREKVELLDNARRVQDSTTQRPPISMRSPQRDPKDQTADHRRLPSFSLLPANSPEVSHSPPRNRSPSRDSSYGSPVRHSNDQWTRKDSPTSPQRPKERRVRHSSSCTSGDEEMIHARDDSERMSKSLQKRSARPALVVQQNDSPIKTSQRDNNSPERLPTRHNAGDVGSKKKDHEPKRCIASERVSHAKDTSQEKLSSSNINSRSGQKQQEAYSGEGIEANEKNHQPQSDVKGGNRPHKLETFQNSTKSDNQNSRSNLDSSCEESYERRAEVKEKRKHKRSRRKETSSDDDDSYDSRREERKEAKRRRIEEKKLRKEERRRRREERRRKKEERRADKLKMKSPDSNSQSLDFDRNQDDYASEGERCPMDTEATESEKKKLEIELREKALESLRAKRSVGH